jgi:hypothetical protein
LDRFAHLDANDEANANHRAVSHQPIAIKSGLERVKGIEPSYEAWEAAVLPLNYTREGHEFTRSPGVVDGAVWPDVGRFLVAPSASPLAVPAVFSASFLDDLVDARGRHSETIGTRPVPMTCCATDQ